MKVYIVTPVSFPNGMAPANRIKCYAKALLTQGVEVEVIVYFRTEVFGVPPKNTIVIGMFEGIPYRYISGTTRRNKNPFIRRINDILDKRKTLSYLKDVLKEGDVVLGYMGLDVDFSLQVINTTHKCKAIFVSDLCELPYVTGEETQARLNKRRKTIEKQAPICDGYICISKALYDYITPHTNQRARNCIVPILVEYDKYKLADLSETAEYPYIFHAGTLTEKKDGVLGMLEAFGVACSSLPASVKFILTGSLEKAKASEQIKNILEKYRISNRVSFTGYLTDEELKEYLSKATLVIINKYDTKQNQYCFSTKLGEYLAAGKPVIITNVGEAMNWLKNNETAYIVPPSNNTELANAIVDAFSSKSKRLEIGNNGRTLCKNSFDYRQWGRMLVELFEDIYKSRND